jgi:hypothetical protein
MTVAARDDRRDHGDSGQEAARKERRTMCYNCGCGMPNNDMGKPENITNKTIGNAARAMGQSPKEARQNARALLEKVLAATEERTDRDWKP